MAVNAYFHFQDNLPQAAVKFFAAAQVATLECGNAVRSHLIKEMAKPKSGKTYLVPGTTRTYVASAPGEYPAIATGILRTSIQVALFHSQTSIMAIIGTTVWYGEALEYRSPGAGGRPWLRRAAMEVKPRMQSIAGRAFRREFKGRGPNTGG